jgi:uncharacterized membrane protein YedE/YeeE
MAAALAGGILIGLSAVLLMALDGRIAGISGIVEGVLHDRGGRLWRVAFLAGLVLGAALAAALGIAQRGTSGLSPWLVTAAGLLVGIGTMLGGGCTSGHGVCGIARHSPRSLLATLVFMAAGMGTVYGIRHAFA